MKNKKIIFAAVALLVVGVFVYFAFFSKSEDDIAAEELSRLEAENALKKKELEQAAIDAEIAAQNAEKALDDAKNNTLSDSSLSLDAKEEELEFLREQENKEMLIAAEKELYNEIQLYNNATVKEKFASLPLLTKENIMRAASFAYNDMKGWNSHNVYSWKTDVVNKIVSDRDFRFFLIAYDNYDSIGFIARTDKQNWGVTTKPAGAGKEMRSIINQLVARAEKINTDDYLLRSYPEELAELQANWELESRTRGGLDLDNNLNVTIEPLETFTPLFPSITNSGGYQLSTNLQPIAK